MRLTTAIDFGVAELGADREEYRAYSAYAVLFSVLFSVLTTAIDFGVAELTAVMPYCSLYCSLR